MILGRGNHHTAETEVLPGSVQTSTASVDTSDEKTPAIWWVKTIASYTLLAAAVALLAALVVVPRLTGSTAYTVLTGSMQPTYPPGTLIVVKPTPGNELEAGDVITFQPKSGDPSVTTHRIVSIVYDAKGERKFITKGDANNTQDEPIVEDQIRGRLFYSVPYLGRLNSIVNGGMRSIAIIVIAIGLGGYALWMWISSIRDRKKLSDDGSDADGPGSAEAGPTPDGPTPPVGTPEPSLPSGRHAVPDGPVCHACGAPPVGAHGASPPLAYSAAAPPLDAYLDYSRREPSNEVTRPIPVVR